ncbi:polysaccharide lyase family 7 protein [Leucothrix arctica]|uniref:Alginate lyase 2 domain-containing protein n=1 Tax=Leucothrix arctica TaxID=1481894 RepID=A0A317CKI4_9GAMM|nr:polysaccharide lyase family 7 protein [Leucothrix arctica]PWQ96830.1 hypothetical protein DKT75_08675 [Leucothrix arctica]
MMLSTNSRLSAAVLVLCTAALAGCGSVEEKAEVIASIPTESASSGGTIPSSITDGSLWELEGSNPDPLVNSKTLIFLPLQAQYTSPNGNGLRHEYKIQQDLRVAMTDTYEQFQANIKVDMSAGGKTIIAQHHAGDLGTIMKVYVSDSSESGFDDSTASNGVFDVYVRLRNTSGVEEKFALGTITTGGSFVLKVVNNYGLVSVGAFGKTFELNVEDDSSSYLKFGNYLQSQNPEGNAKCGTPGDTSSFLACYASFGITESRVTMTDVSYSRVER